MTDFRLVSTTTGFQAKTVVCRGSGKTAMPGMTRALQICTVQQHLYGSSLPGSPSWCGCVPELIWETTSLGATSLCQQQFLMQMWPEWCKPHEQKGLFNLYQLHCATLAFFHELCYSRYFLEASTEIEQSSIDQDYDIQEKKRMIHIL